jgi:putative transposase
MKQRFSEEQIIRILKEAKAVRSLREVSRKHDITERTFYGRRKKFRGMDVSEARRLKNLERKNVEPSGLVRQKARREAESCIWRDSKTDCRESTRFAPRRSRLS